MHLIESHFFCKQKSPSLAETLCSESEHAVAVIEGNTPKPAALYGGKSAAKFAVDSIAQTLEVLHAGVRPDELVRALTYSLNQQTVATTGRPAASIAPEHRPAASAAVFLKRGHCVVLIGDCQALVAGVPHQPENPFRAVQRRMFKQHFSELFQQGFDPGICAQIAGEWIVSTFSAGLAMRNTDNTSAAFSALDGTPLPFGLVKVIEVPPGATVTLASSAYPVLRDDFSEAEQALAQHLALRPGTEMSWLDRAYVKVQD